VVPGCGLGFSISLSALVLLGKGVPGFLRIDHVVWWNLGIAFAVAEPHRVTAPEHDVVGAGAALHGLVKIVAHGVIIGELLEIGHIALLHVVEAHGRRTLAGREIIEGLRLGLSVRAGTDRHFPPWEEIGGAAPAVASSAAPASQSSLESQTIFGETGSFSSRRRGHIQLVELAGPTFGPRSALSRSHHRDPIQSLL
jgi:hypothetical protein